MLVACLSLLGPPSESVPSVIKSSLGVVEMGGITFLDGMK